MSKFTAKDIIEYLEEIVKVASGEYYERYEKEICEAYHKVIDEVIRAVKKTFPQKVKYDPFGVECPNCSGRIVLPSTYTFNGNMIGIRCNYCYSCGQALDWSEEQ